MTTTLHADGWRQGSIFTFSLHVTTVTVSGAAPEYLRPEFSLWVIASQDCDLDVLEADDDEQVVEVRPVLSGNPGIDWGIRSRRLRLTADKYVDAFEPRLMVSPRLLSQAALSSRMPPLTADRARAFKTWLGRRYDRPAVPPEFVELARGIAGAVKDTRTQALADATHDVLMQFHAGDPPRYALIAVALEDADVAAVEDWMARAALQVPADQGLLTTPPSIVNKSSLSLATLEESYAADLSSITWQKHSRGVAGI